MKGKPRKTATFIMDTNEKSIIEAQKYEIDKKQIYDFYGKKPKEERVYNVIKKQIAFGKDTSFEKIDKNKKYSNYLVFRENLQKELDIEDIKSEMEQVKLLINLSENTRDEFYHFFHFDRADYINNGEIPTHTQMGIGMKGDPIFTTKNSDENRQPLSVKDFLRKCTMLRRKREEKDNNDTTKSFKVYSDLNIPSNKYAAMDCLYSKKKKLNEKFFNQKELLIRCFNREERFTNFNKLIKDSYKTEVPDTLNSKTKDKYSSKYFNLMFDKRDESHYESIDHFFSKYNITSFKLKDEEADFYGKIYGILCKNNYMKFLSFLYSKNDIFKYIYDDFSIKIPVSLSLDNSLASQLQSKLDDENNQSLSAISESFTENKVREKELGNSLDSKSNTNANNNIISDFSEEDKVSDNVKNNELLPEIFNSYLYIKIGFLNKAIKEKNIVSYFSNDEEGKQNDNNDNKEKAFVKHLKECKKLPLNDILLINKEKKLKIIDNKYNNIIEKKMSITNFVEINKEKISNLLRDSVNAKYYLIQIKKVKKEKEKSEYYLFKVGIKNIKIFEDKVNNDFKYITFKNFMFICGQNNKKKSKKSKKKEKKKKKEKEKELNETKKEEKSQKETQKNKENSKEEEKESKKSEENKSKEPQEVVRPFKTPDTSSEKNTDKKQASIIESSSDSQSENGGPDAVEKVIKNSNIKNASKYQNEQKTYDFIVNDKKSTVEITKGKLRVQPYNGKMIKVALNEINPLKVDEDRENSGYKLEIKKGKQIIFKVFHDDKNVLNNFYYDLKESK